MMFISSCLSSMRECFGVVDLWQQGPQRDQVPLVADNEEHRDVVLLDAAAIGAEAVLVKSATRLCGTGCARATTAVHQNKAYWEIKVQQSGQWSCGLMSANADLGAALGLDERSWALTSENEVRSSKEKKSIDINVQEGDVIGLTYDHVELNFYLNGEQLNCPITGIKGTVYPALYVDDGAILDAIFDAFRYPVPAGFDRLMIEKALL